MNTLIRPHVGLSCGVTNPSAANLNVMTLDGIAKPVTCDSVAFALAPAGDQGGLVVGPASTAASHCGVYNGVCLTAGAVREATGVTDLSNQGRRRDGPDGGKHNLWSDNFQSIVRLVESIGTG